MINNKALIQNGYSKHFAPAKLNLFLKIINKRRDGYHNLQSVFQLINLQDDVWFIAKYTYKLLNLYCGFNDLII